MRPLPAPERARRVRLRRGRESLAHLDRLIYQCPTCGTKILPSQYMTHPHDCPDD